MLIEIIYFWRNLKRRNWFFSMRAYYYWYFAIELNVVSKSMKLIQMGDFYASDYQSMISKQSFLLTHNLLSLNPAYWTQNFKSTVSFIVSSCWGHAGKALTGAWFPSSYYKGFWNNFWYREHVYQLNIAKHNFNQFFFQSFKFLSFQYRQCIMLYKLLDHKSYNSCKIQGAQCIAFW